MTDRSFPVTNNRFGLNEKEKRRTSFFKNIIYTQNLPFIISDLPMKNSFQTKQSGLNNRQFPSKYNSSSYRLPFTFLIQTDLWIDSDELKVQTNRDFDGNSVLFFRPYLWTTTCRSRVFRNYLSFTLYHSLASVNVNSAETTIPADKSILSHKLSDLSFALFLFCL